MVFYWSWGILYLLRFRRKYKTKAFECLAFGQMAELPHGYVFLAPNWGPVGRFPNIFHLCLVILATSSRCQWRWVTVVRSQGESALSNVLCSGDLHRGIGEVRWCTVGHSQFAPFGVPDHKARAEKSTAHMILSPLPVHRFRSLFILSIISILSHHLETSFKAV